MDPIKDLQSKLKESGTPVSAFFLIKSHDDAARMLTKIELLFGQGVKESDIQSICELIEELLAHESPDQSILKVFEFVFHRPEPLENLSGCLKIRDFEGQGFEVELIMPGIIASSVPKLFDNGFWTAFMPPAFYA